MKKILFYIHRIQDISVLSPLIHSFSSEEVIVHTDFLKIIEGKRGYVERLLKQYRIDYIQKFNLKENRDKIGIVITTGAHKNSGLLAKKARRLSIPSLTLQHGITNELENGKPIKFYSDLIALWGPCQKDFFCNKEFSLLKRRLFWKRTNSPTDKKRFFITGAPKFDDLYKPKEVDRNPLGIPELKKVVSVFTNTHWATRYSEEGNQRFCDTLESLVKKSKDLFWIFKLHPEEDPDLCKCRFHDINYCKVICPKEEKSEIETHDILRMSDVVIMALSTVALEAAILKKPVISMNFADKPGYRNLLEYHEDIEWVLMEALENPEKFIRQQEAFVQGFHPGKGNATENLRKIVLYILKEGVRYNKLLNYRE